VYTLPPCAVFHEEASEGCSLLFASYATSVSNSISRTELRYGSPALVSGSKLSRLVVTATVTVPPAVRAAVAFGVAPDGPAPTASAAATVTASRPPAARRRGRCALPIAGLLSCVLFGRVLTTGRPGSRRRRARSTRS